MNRKRGSMAVEFALSLVLFAFLLSGFVSLARLAHQRQQLHDIARLGAFLKSTGVVADNVTRAEIARAIDIDGLSSLNPQVTMTRYLGSPSARFYQLSEVRIRASMHERLVDESVVVENAGDKS